MTLAPILAEVVAELRLALVPGTREDGEYVDVDESVRRRLIREASYQQWCDEQSKVMRVSGKPHRGRYPLRRLHAR